MMTERLDSNDNQITSNQVLASKHVKIKNDSALINLESNQRINEDFSFENKNVEMSNSHKFFIVMLLFVTNLLNFIDRYSLAGIIVLNFILNTKIDVFIAINFKIIKTTF